MKLGIMLKGVGIGRSLCNKHRREKGEADEHNGAEGELEVCKL
jgi:hypothetical protein